MFFFRVGQGSHPLSASSQLCISALWRIITATLDSQNLYVKCNHFSYFCTPVKSQDPGNRMPELNSISSLLLGSQTERRYQSPNMYLDTIAEEKQYKSYWRIFLNTWQINDKWEHSPEGHCQSMCYFALNSSSHPLLNGFYLTYEAQLGRKSIGLAKNKYTWASQVHLLVL